MGFARFPAMPRPARSQERAQWLAVKGDMPVAQAHRLREPLVPVWCLGMGHWKRCGITIMLRLQR